MATREQIETALRNADAAGDVDAAKQLAGALKNMSVATERAPEGESNILPSLAMGARQAWDAGSQYLARAAEHSFPSVRPSRERMEAGMRDVFKGYGETFDPAQTTGNAIARGVGQAGITAPLVPAMKAGGVAKAAAQGGGVGAGSGFFTPVYDIPEGSDFFNEKRKQMGLSTVTGAGLGAVGNVVGKAIAPKIEAGVRAMLDAKVPLTAGQTLGGIAKGVEDRLAGFPFVGDIINRSRRESIEGFNRAIYSRAVEKFGAEGKALVKETPVGHDGIKAVGNFLSGKYEEALGKSVPAPLTKDFGRSLNHLKTMVPKALREDFQNIINAHVLPTPAGTITPSVAKSADSALGQLAAGYRGSSTESERQLGRALAQAQSELRELFASSNPQTAELIRAADHGWRTIAQMENAGAMIGADKGVFTPAHFMRAVKNSDKSLRDRQFARGDAWNQAFAEQAKHVLPNKVPDSGTAGRAALGLGVMGMVDAGTTAMLAAPYLPGVSPLVRAALSKRPAWAEPLADQVKRTAPYLGLLSGPLTNQ
jgi:hypothetical protein